VFLYPLFQFFETNKTARWVLGIVTGVALYKLYERLRDNRIRKRAEEKIIEKIEAKEDKLKEQANEAENRVTADLNTRSLQDVSARSPENLGPVRRD